MECSTIGLNLGRAKTIVLNLAGLYRACFYLILTVNTWGQCFLFLINSKSNAPFLFFLHQPIDMTLYQINLQKFNFNCYFLEKPVKLSIYNCFYSAWNNFIIFPNFVICPLFCGALINAPLLPVSSIPKPHPWPSWKWNFIFFVIVANHFKALFKEAFVITFSQVWLIHVLSPLCFSGTVFHSYWHLLPWRTIVCIC